MAFPSNGLIDNFNRSNEGPPMTGWADLAGGLRVSSNTAVANAIGLNISYYTTILTEADCEVYVTIATVPSSNRSMYVCALLGDISGSSFDGYALKFNKVSGTDTLQIVRFDDGVETVLGANFSQELVAGNKFGLEIVAGTLTAYVDTGSGWTSLGSRTDSTYTTAGYLGLGMSSGAVDDFGGGGLASSSPQTLVATSIDSAEAFSTHTAAPGAVTLQSGEISSAEAFETAVVDQGAVAVLPGGMASLEAFETATLQAAISLVANSIASGEAFGTAVLQTLATLLASGIASAEAFGLCLDRFRRNHRPSRQYCQSGSLWNGRWLCLARLFCSLLV
jgi:hypothetical protein